MDSLETVLNSYIQESRATIAEIRLDIGEMRQWRVESQKRWGEIAQKMGTFVEDIVAPNIPHVAGTVFGLGGQGDEMLSAPRVRIWHPADSSKVREFDYIYATRRRWVVV